MILFGSLSHHCTLTLTLSYADLFLIHNFINYNSTYTRSTSSAPAYTAYFSVNDPCSFGFQSFRCQVVSTKVTSRHQVNSFRCKHQIDSLQQWRFLLFTVLNILNDGLHRSDFFKFVSRRLCNETTKFWTLLDFRIET